tara:strand:- start:296 stop:433 length:138 start_codon:yes stop_codon:yes gene_type:complete
MTPSTQIPLYMDRALLAAIERAKRAHDDHQRWREERDLAEGPVRG